MHRTFRIGTLGAAAPVAAFAALLASAVTTAPQAAGTTRRVAEAFYGGAVAISGSNEIVGAWGLNVQQGAAYIYARSGGSWHQQAALPDPGGVNGDDFGTSVAISGTTAVIGAPTVTYGDAYIYARSGHAWVQQAALAGPDFEYYGDSVAVDGNTALVGAFEANNNLGAVYVYVRSGTTWHQQARLSLPGGSTYVAFGTDVAISGNTAIISAPGEYSGIGAVYIYVRSSGHWRRQKEFINPVRTGKTVLGTAVALSGGTAAIEDSNGKVYVYVRSGTTWRAQAKLADPVKSAGSGLGGAMALSSTSTGMRLLVGATPSGARLCGTAFDFARSGSAWHEKEKITDPSCARDDRFGAAIGLSGKSAIIGAPNKNNAAGAIFRFTIR